VTETLIIRSASIQQLDLNLPAVKNRFGGSMLSLLTHSHCVKAAEKYPDIDRVYVYKHKSGFRFWQKAAGVTNRSFEATVVQTANASGSGYLNVLLFALTVRAKKIYICGPASEITEIKKSTIVLKTIFTVTFKFVSIILTLPAVIMLCIIAIVGGSLLKNKK